MSFRAIVQDGLIVINTHGKIPDGTPVRVVADEPARRKAAPKRAAKKPRRRRTEVPLEELPAFGMWKNRWKGKSTLQVLRELRAKSLGRHRRG